MSLPDKRGWTKHGRCTAEQTCLRGDPAVNVTGRNIARRWGDLDWHNGRGGIPPTRWPRRTGRAPYGGGVHRDSRLNGIVADMLGAWGARDDKHWAIER